MKTIILNKPGEFQLVQRNEIDAATDGEALVKIRRIGICGTDYHAFRGHQPFFAYPRVLGHELGAEIAAIGNSQSVTHVKIGDKVAIEPYLNCNTCQACRSGRSNCCEHLRVLGVHIDGGMTEYLNVPVNKLHKSDLLSFDQLALVEMLGIGLHAVNRALVTPNDNVLVIGAGPIGLSVAQFATLKGAHVVMADQNQNRLHFIAKQAISHMNILVDDALTTDTLRAHFDNDLPTVIFDATGNRASMLATFDLIAHGGRIVYVGLFQGDIQLDDPNFHRREISLLASRNALPADFKTIISLMETGQIDTNPWLSHRTTLDRLPGVFKTFLDPEQALIKAIVDV